MGRPLEDCFIILNQSLTLSLAYYIKKKKILLWITPLVSSRKRFDIENPPSGGFSNNDFYQSLLRSPPKPRSR